MKKKRIIVSAMIARYDGEFNPEAGDEIWSVNGSFRHDPRISRIYAMDDLVHLGPSWSDEINMLPDRIRYIGPRHYDEIPRSEAYPIHDVLDYFKSPPFFVCTFAYIIAAAIYEGATDIVLSGAYWPHDSEEYVSHISCVNWWVGRASGSGINIEIHGPTQIGKPHPWEPALYGFETNETRHVIHAAIAAAYRFASTFPCKFVTHVDIDKDVPKADAETVDVTTSESIDQETFVAGAV